MIFIVDLNLFLDFNYKETRYLKNIMRLKKLSLCLFALSLTACSSHVIKSNNATTNALDQRASDGLNAMFDYPSYDYNGTFKFAVDNASVSKENISNQSRFADPELEKQVQAVLKAQRINLSSVQLQQLYQAIAAEELGESSSASSSRSKKIEGFVMKLLSEMQFSYDGSVHYKQKMASMNLTVRYEKPTLLVQAKVPMVVDFNAYKFYTNYFALMPFMVNKDSQNSLAYIDFSKYKKDLEKLDVKALVSYLKESSALPYLLADAQNIETVSLNAQDKAQGAVDKIRLKISLEEWLLQARLYEQINKPYFQAKMSSVFPNNDATADAASSDVIAEYADASSDDADSLSTYGMSAQEAEAYRASQNLYKLVNAQFNSDDDRTEDDEEADCETAGECAVAASSAAVDAAAMCTSECNEAINAASTDTEEADSSDDEGTLSAEQCQAMTVQKKRPAIGDIQSCMEEHEIDLLVHNTVNKPQSVTSEDAPSFINTVFSTEKTELDQRFESYASKEFKDAKAFKVLWDQHQADVKKELARQGSHNPVLMDVALDKQGRAVRIDYDIQFKTKASGILKFKTDMNILNYGNATAINRTELNQAKSIEEVGKGSPLENMVNGFSKSLGVDTTQASGAVTPLSLKQQLNDLAIQVYDSTKSYSKTYQAVFIVKMSAEQPNVVKLFSPSELNEIGSVYAYAYADESIYNPQGKVKEELDRLVKKHHLELNDQYNDRVGESVYSVVVDAIEGQKDRQAWKTFVQKHKTAKSAFTEYYVSEFLSDFEEGDLDAEQKASLRKTAKILAQAYEDTRKNQLTAKTIHNLKEDDVGFIDYDLYRKTFEKVGASFK